MDAEPFKIDNDNRSIIELAKLPGN